MTRALPVRQGKVKLDPIALVCRAYGWPEPQKEFRFHPVRKWRFDHAWVADLVALEIEGATWVQGRHTRGKGFEQDCVKYAEATLLGWAVFRATTQQVTDGTVADWLNRALTRVNLGELIGVLK